MYQPIPLPIGYLNEMSETAVHLSNMHGPPLMGKWNICDHCTA